MLNHNSKLLLATLAGIQSYDFGLLTNAHAATLNDTGITTCSNATQNDLPCPVAGFPGQDAEYGTNSFDFTKLDANGNAMPVTATNHSCVKDNVTGLMWEVKTDDDGLRDKDNTYNFDEAATFAAQVNATNLCGYNNWRVPEPHELVSIVDYGVYKPTIDNEYFPSTVNSYYWTNSASHIDPYSYSWIVNFIDGHVSDGDTYQYRDFFVRCVRAGQLPFSFIDQGDGTIKDNNTNLVWAKCSHGQTFANGSCSGSATSLTWQQALQAADGLTLAGQSDWRLPNVKELQSLADYTKYSPAINSTYFPNTPYAHLSLFWTSSTYFNYTDTSSSLSVNFTNGSSSYYLRSGNYFVRCVRGGHSDFFLFSLSINRLGAGSGTVVSNPTDINCGTVCAANFAENTAVTLTATPAAGSAFGGWSGDADCSDGSVTMNANKNCTATFTLNPVATAPTVTTSAATNLTATSATLNGNVSSNGATANVNFNFGTTTAYGQTIAAVPAQINSNTAVAVTASKTGLTCNTTYHYRVTATNSAGTSNGADQNFTTTACAPVVNPPTVVTGNATNIAANGVTLNGMVNSNGASTTVIFELGPTTDYGMKIDANPNVLDATALNVTVTANPTGLACKTTYHYRIKATNSAGPSNGSNKQLTTADCPPIDEDKHARALIIGGKTEANDPLHDEIPLAMIQALLSLEVQGYSIDKHDLQVLWNGTAPSRHDGTTIPVTTVTTADFTANTELTNWAQDASRLLIYMVGHGNTNVFFLDDTTDQSLTADDLKTWLSLVQPQTSRATNSDNDITLIYEACYSGSFLPKLAAPNRILLTSASETQRALMNNLNSYSFSLWSALKQGGDLGIAEYKAEQEMVTRPSPQTPQLDADGNGIPNQDASDREIVKGRCIGILNDTRACLGYGAAAPELKTVAANQTLNGETTANLWLEIRSEYAASVDKAWAVIARPDFQPNPNQAFDQLPMVDLTPDATKQRWTGNYSQFNVAGSYTISYYVKNADGPSTPMTSTVTQTQNSTPTETKAALESPQQGSYESGIGLVRGWVCQANKIEIQIDGGNKRQVAYGTARGDTQATCGHPNTGFGYTYNWNVLSNGTHNLKAFADNVQFADVNFTTTNLGTSYLTGANGQHTLANFPATGKTATLKWSEPHQNFVISNATRNSPRLGPPQTRNGITGNLESPQAGSYESGIALIRGWMCQADKIEIQIDGGIKRQVAYGTARGDTQQTCGHANTGFGFVYNWNALSDGTHNLRLLVNDQEFTNVNFTVTTLGGNYLQGLSRDEAFNFNGRNIKVRWAEPHQNFVIVP